jgi:hypothetical protein
VEALNRIEEFKSVLARLVNSYIVNASSVGLFVRYWLYFFRFERLDRLLFTRTLIVSSRYRDSLRTNKLELMRTWRSWTIS